VFETLKVVARLVLMELKAAGRPRTA
jgi:hypothetical protein